MSPQDNPLPDVQPIFPPEIEREIFLLAARAYRGTAFRLVLVAARVKAWIEPFMYKTVVLRGAKHACQFYSAIVNHRPPEFARSHVRQLCIRPSVPATLATQILTACSRLNTLAFFTAPYPDTASIINLLSSLPLTFLSINLMSIQLATLPDPELHCMPVFSNVTHLDVANNWAFWTPSLGIELPPRLTHLSIRFWPRGSVGNTLMTIVMGSPNLQYVVLLANVVVMASAREYLEKQGIRDIRVVVLQHSRDAEEWEVMERESMTIWQRAEYIVRWRQRNRGGCKVHGNINTERTIIVGPYDFPPGFAFGSPKDASQPSLA